MRNIGTLKIVAAESATTSSDYTNNSADACALQIWGTASALKVQIQGMIDIDADTWVDIASYDKSDLQVIDGTTGMTSAGIFSVDVAGVQKVRVKVSTVTGGNVNVTAMFVDTTTN